MMSEADDAPHQDRAGDSLGLDEAVSSLSRITRRLDAHARQVLLLTLLNLATLALVSLWANGALSLGNRVVATVGPVVLGVVTLLNIAMFDIARRRGSMLYEEISEEMQWRLRERITADEPADARPPLYVRLALREFASSSELPLMPGRAGVTIVAILNIFLAVVAVSLAAIGR